MLNELLIENFAIIDRLLLRFEPGFTVLTGETGAGKSIIVDALQAALGGRVGADVIRTGARQSSVEAVFDTTAEIDDSLAPLLSDLGIDLDGTLILRRDVQPTGRSSARVNGRAVPVSALQTIGALLVDIHGQSDHLSILRRDRQLDVLDRYGSLDSLRAETAHAIKRFSDLQTEWRALSSGQAEAERRLDLLRFQVEEIEGAALSSGEEQDLLEERNRLVNAERLTQLSGTAYEALEGDARDMLGQAVSSTRELAAIDPAFSPLAERVAGLEVELDDVASELRRYRDSVEYDPGRLDAIEERVDLITRLKRKYGPTVDDVLEFGRLARAELEDVENLDERLAQLEGEVETASAEAGTLAMDLSRRRHEAAEQLSADMAGALRGLNLGGTAFQIEFSRTQADNGLRLPGLDGTFSYTQSGVDTVTFLVSFNPGEVLRPLDKVASGGETSRFLLALKSVLAQADRTPTLVFDEVDVGVGGRAGSSVGERLRELGRHHQVLSITHLPQVAALADAHMTVEKDVAAGRTGVGVRLLERDERVDELAHMMSGLGTEAARRSAAELLDSVRTRS